MSLKKPLGVVAALLLVAALTACNLAKASQPTPDVNALYTAAAGTLVAQFNDQQTQTAAAVTPTPLASPATLATFAPLPTLPLGLTPFGTFAFSTPAGGLTPLPTLPQGTGVYSFPVGCNDAQFIGETKPFDKTTMSPLNGFKKGWSLQNVGTCSWGKGYTFAFKSGDQMQGIDVQINTDTQFTDPGHSQAFVIRMVAPKATGEYIGRWQMQDDKGVWFGSVVTVDIIVQ
jgi:hypothetical protein